MAYTAFRFSGVVESIIMACIAGLPRLLVMTNPTYAMANNQITLFSGIKLIVISKNITALNEEVDNKTFFRGNRSDIYPPIKLIKKLMMTVNTKNNPAHTLLISRAKNNAIKGITADDTARLKKEVIKRTLIFCG